MTRTLMIVKPGNEHLIDEILAEVSNAGLIVEAIQHFTLSDEDIIYLYRDKLGKSFFGRIVKYLTSGKSYIYVLKGENPTQKLLAIKGKGNNGGIRGKYAKDIIYNILHCPDSDEDAQREIKLLFGWG